MLGECVKHAWKLAVLMRQAITKHNMTFKIVQNCYELEQHAGENKHIYTKDLEGEAKPRAGGFRQKYFGDSRKEKS